VNRDDRVWNEFRGQDANGDGNANTDGDVDDADAGDDDSPTLEELFGPGAGHGVKYVVNTRDQQPSLDEYGHGGTGTPAVMLLARADKDTEPVIKDIAIMPFESPLFPGAREFLYIYEMRFRSLMNDVESAGNLLGRCFVSSSGGIGLVGSFCNIVERKKLKDGKGFYIVEAHSRFKIRRIVSTEPYLRAEVEMIDDITPMIGDNELCERLCKDVYCELKAYLRIARLQDQDSDGGEETLGLSQAIRDNRPLFARRGDAGIVSCAETDGGAMRHRAFSHACANLLATDPEVMQQLLQSQSTCYRLQGLKRILIEAVEELCSLMVDDGLITEDEFADILEASAHPDDDDSDLLSPGDSEGVTLASELDAALIEELGINEDAFVDLEFRWQHSAQHNGRMQPKFTDPRIDTPDAAGSGSGGVGGGDVWDGGADAFQ